MAAAGSVDCATLIAAVARNPAPRPERRTALRNHQTKQVPEPVKLHHQLRADLLRTSIRGIFRYLIVARTITVSPRTLVAACGGCG